MTKKEMFAKCVELGLIKGDTSDYVMRGYSKDDLAKMIAAAEAEQQEEAKAKYSDDEYVFVRIPAKLAHVPNGRVTRVQIHCSEVWKDEVLYFVRSAKYGLLRYKECDIYKHKADVK